MSTHNICFCGEIRKLLSGYPLLSGRMEFPGIFPQNHILGYSLEAPLQGTSNVYAQDVFLWKNKENINTSWLKKKETSLY